MTATHAIRMTGALKLFLTHAQLYIDASEDPQAARKAVLEHIAGELKASPDLAKAREAGL